MSEIKTSDIKKTVLFYFLFSTKNVLSTLGVNQINRFLSNILFLAQGCSQGGSRGATAPQILLCPPNNFS